MRVIIDTFFTLSYFTVILIQLILFLRDAIKSVHSTRPQRIFQLFFLFSLFFLSFSQVKLLRTVYRQKIFDFENNPMGSKLKSLQYMSESTLHSVLIYSFAVILNYFQDFKLKSITDQNIYSLSSLIYGFVRTIPISLILMSIHKNTPFSSFLFETFFISEDIVKILLFIILMKTILKMKEEIEACLMNDKTSIQYFLSSIKLICKKLTVAISSECLYRLLYLVVILNPRSSFLVFIRDLSNLIKIFSIYLMLEGLRELSFVDCKEIKASCDENENDRFFIFE